jgi:hypothetical protein
MADFIAENQEATLHPRSLSRHSLSLLSATSLTARPQAFNTAHDEKHQEALAFFF